MSPAQFAKMDLVDVAAPRKVRLVASIPGRYTLTNRLTLLGERREFACRAVSITPYVLVLAVPVVGDIGERIITHFADFGKLEGRIFRKLEHGFALRITATEEERMKLAAKIDWLERNKNSGMHDDRKHKRLIPENPHSTLLLADGSTLTCFVIDMSVSGAAVSADIDPDIGTPLAVGKAVGRVVRRFPEGFAVRFVEPLHEKLLEPTVISS